MLILTRKRKECIVCGKNGEIKFFIVEINKNQVRIGIEAPKDIPVHREEVFNRICADKLSEKENISKNDEQGND